MNIALAILAHPDDAEFLCAGTLIRIRQERGYAIHIATMTPGDCGSAEYPPEEISCIRRTEGANAAKAIGAEYTCLEERDLRVIYGEACRMGAARLKQLNVTFKQIPYDIRMR